jgi:hypothetical protein
MIASYRPQRSIIDHRCNAHPMTNSPIRQQHAEMPENPHCFSAACYTEILPESGFRQLT